MSHEAATDRQTDGESKANILIREKLSFGRICKRLIGTGCPHACERGLIASSDQSLFVTFICVASYTFGDY